MERTGFPSDETLAAFLDGNLDPDTRRRVIEHMTICEECYSVVAGAGAGGMSSVSPDKAAAVPQRATVTRWRLYSGAGGAAALALTLTFSLLPARKDFSAEVNSALPP